MIIGAVQALWPFLPRLLAGVILPGYLLGKLIRSPAPGLSSFLGSGVVLFYLVLGLDALHQPIALGSLALALMVVNGALLAAVWFQSRRAGTRAVTPTQPVPDTTGPLPGGRLWMLPAFLAIAAVAIHATTDPLSGWDTLFRWDFLARQMLRYSSLSFYPPVTAEDFTHYGWADGIPPLVPVLNLWSYLSAGSLDTVFTMPRVVLEAGLVFYGVWRLARGLWGAAAGWPATAVLATSSLVLWSVANGQETGLTALTLVAMFVFLDEHRRGGDPHALIWAGLAAGVGGLSREYGLAWMVIGLVALFARGAGPAGIKTFLPVALAVAVPWYLRNWLHTGNPVYAHAVGGFFPGNSVLREIMAITNDHFAIRYNWPLLPLACAFLAIMAGAAGVLGLAGFAGGSRASRPVFGGMLVVFFLWVWSLSQTAGGWIYATRVLAPAVALAAVGAAGLVTRLGPRVGRGLGALVLVLSADAAFRSFYLPHEPFVNPASYFSRPAVDPAGFAATQIQFRLWEIVAREAGARSIVVDDANHGAVFTNLGARAIPLMSPQISFLFDDRLSFPDVVARLRQQEVRFILLTRRGAFMDDFDSRHRFLRELRSRHKPMYVLGSVDLYDLDFMTP